ncbi:MAG: glycoside hydrolase family 2 TIM barrel-domain containing protein, partial [Kiritimatiellae bacterium]|nr:glycoside hydrolase family 2 TIM barrel-domain containing protein [Kiritimatiellia bacterium]
MASHELTGASANRRGDPARGTIADVAGSALAPVRVNPVLRHAAERRLALDGAWRFGLDPEDRGTAERWFERPENLPGRIDVPGCWQGQGFGGDGKDLLWDFRLEARVFRATYTGTGWYGRLFRPPADWTGTRLWLNFGGVHPSAEVWLNGVRLGANHEPFVPFGFEVTSVVRFGEDNRLAVRVHEENRLLGLCFNAQGNWSGLYRGVELTATGPAFLRHVQVHPDVERGMARVRIEADGLDPAGQPLRARLSIAAIGGGAPAVRLDVDVAAGIVEQEVPVPSPRLWSPDAPNLYRADVVLERGPETMDALSERFGFVKLSAENHRFLINDEPYFMRGTGDFLIHPETVSPDTDRERWRRKLRTLRAYGYNYVRCQSYAPAPEYLDVADEVGLLVQSEMGMLGAWGGSDPYHIYAWPQPTPSCREALRSQWNRVVRRDVNHPSANLYCMSNELLTSCPFPRTAWRCYRETKAIKPTALVIWTDGGHNDDLPGDFINVFAAGLAAGEASDQLAKYEQSGKPIIQHEFAWWSSFPDVRNRHKYAGALRPYAIEIATEAATRQGLTHLLPEFADRSQRLQLLEAKAKLENCRRNLPRLAGICHFDAMDSNLSPQGVIDEFYEPKLADAATWLQTNGDTVILSSLGFGDRIARGGDAFTCRFYVSDFSHPPLCAPTLEWRLTAGGDTLASGSLRPAHQAYCAYPAGEATLTVPELPCPVAARIEAVLHEGHRRVANSWNLWLFPRAIVWPEAALRYGQPEHTWLRDWSELPSLAADDLGRGNCRVVLSERLDEALVDFMRGGGRVILAAGEGLVRPHGPLFGYVKYFFTPPANYAPYEDGQNGTLIREHPMLGQFPHAGFADFQFFRLMEDAPPIELRPLDLADDEPVIRVIHRYQVCHPLAYLLERSVGRGGLIVCALELKPA